MLAGKPAVIVPVYYDCPSLCGINQNQLAAQLKKLELKAGKILPLSVLALILKKITLWLTTQRKVGVCKPAGYQKETYNTGWRFTVAERDSIEKLTQSTGFKYEKEVRLRPCCFGNFPVSRGKITRYLYGTQYSELDLKLKNCNGGCRGENR